MKKQMYICLLAMYLIHAAEERTSRTSPATRNRAQTESLTGKINAKHQELDSLVRSVPNVAPLIDEWNQLDQEVKKLEDEAGVTQLLKEFAQYQEKACTVQRTNPESREILRKIGQLNKEIRQNTQSEQTKIDNLYAELESTDQSKQKTIGAQIKPYQEAIQKKSKKQVEQIAQLNNQLRNLPEIKKIIEEAKVLSQKIKESVNSIKKQVLSLNKKKQDIMDKISTLVAQSDISEKIYDAQDAWAALRRNLTKQDPCKRDTRRPSYLQYLN